MQVKSTKIINKIDFERPHLNTKCSNRITINWRPVYTWGDAKDWEILNANDTATTKMLCRMRSVFLLIKFCIEIMKIKICNSFVNKIKSLHPLEIKNNLYFILFVNFFLSNPKYYLSNFARKFVLKSIFFSLAVRTKKVFKHASLFVRSSTWLRTNKHVKTNKIF